MAKADQFQLPLDGGPASFAPPRPPAPPVFGGNTYVAARDGARLTAQLRLVYLCMKDGEWRTLAEISERTGTPQPSVSARLRDFRKARFGAIQVDRKNLAKGLFTYRLRIPRPPPAL